VTALTSGQAAFLHSLAVQITAQPRPPLTPEFTAALVAGAAMLPEALADLDTARSRLALMRAEYAALLAAARAAVAAAQAGEADPLGYVRGVLEGGGQLPAAGARPAWIVADARSAMALTGAGWPS
jgi:hypothetical protein